MSRSVAGGTDAACVRAFSSLPSSCQWASSQVAHLVSLSVSTQVPTRGACDARDSLWLCIALRKAVRQQAHQRCAGPCGDVQSACYGAGVPVSLMLCTLVAECVFHLFVFDSFRTLELTTIKTFSCSCIYASRRFHLQAATSATASQHSMNRRFDDFIDYPPSRLLVGCLAGNP